jgi:hypothetical protein
MNRFTGASLIVLVAGLSACADLAGIADLTNGEGIGADAGGPIDTAGVVDADSGAEGGAACVKPAGSVCALPFACGCEPNETCKLSD